MHITYLIISIVSYFVGIGLGLNFPAYEGIRLVQQPGILEIFFNNRQSSTNLWTQSTLAELLDITLRLQNNTEIKVVIFRSDVPGYFLNHLDLTITPFGKEYFLGFLALPAAKCGGILLTRLDVTIADRDVDLLFRLTNLPQVTIAAVEGVARGAGNELIIALDMRFATKARTLLGQPELGVGLVPGGGGSQNLPRLIGRGRAMEYILCAQDINAQDAEKIGWINKAFDSSDEMNAYIGQLTSRLVLFPQRALAAAKHSINLAARPPLADLQADAVTFVQMASTSEAQELIARTVEITRNQSDNDVERFLGTAIPRLYVS